MQYEGWQFHEESIIKSNIKFTSRAHKFYGYINEENNNIGKE